MGVASQPPCFPQPTAERFSEPIDASNRADPASTAENKLHWRRMSGRTPGTKASWQPSSRTAPSPVCGVHARL